MTEPVAVFEEAVEAVEAVEPEFVMNTADAVVAVVTSCFNQLDYIGNILAAVASQQTAATVHHVVVDDGSTDGSLALLRDWEASHDRVRVLSVTNRGMAGAFNAALMALPAEAEYVVTIAGDDWFEDDFVEECLLAFRPGVDMVVPQMRRVTQPGLANYKGRGVFRDELPSIRNPTVDQLWEWEITYAYAVAMFRREALVETGGYHHGAGGDCDWDLWIDLAARGYQFGYTDTTRFYYLYVPDSSCRTKTPEEWNRHRLEMARHHRRPSLPGPEFA